MFRDQDDGRPGPGRKDPHHVRGAVRQIRADLRQGGGDPDESQETREGGVRRGDAVARPGRWGDHYAAGVMLTPGSEVGWNSCCYQTWAKRRIKDTVWPGSARWTPAEQCHRDTDKSKFGGGVDVD